jgi:predicted short-subunit dehydrogenase-like oxidoreductase (DUF2520 family)
VEAVVSRRLGRARRAAALSGEPQPLALSLAKVDQLPPSEIIFITTPDDAIAATAELLASYANSQRYAGIALHTSGALTSDILGSLGSVGFRTGSMHPLVSVSDAVSGAERLRGAFYAVEGERAAVRVARGVVRDLGGRSFSIASSDKALYHAAAVMTSGHVVALFEMATELLERCGLKSAQARAVLLPLLRSTLENLSKNEPSRALTGTFARADISTVRRHTAALRSQKMPDALSVYALLGNRSLQLAARRGADPKALKEIAKEMRRLLLDKEEEKD